MTTPEWPNNATGVIQRVAPVDVPEILASMQGLEKIPGGVVIGNGANVREVLPGRVLARLTADVTGYGLSGNYIASKNTVLTVAAADAAATITVEDAHPFVSGETIIIDDGADASTAAAITAIDYDTNVITVAVTGGTNPLPIGSRVYADGAGGVAAASAIAMERYTPNASLGAWGRVSAAIGGLFKKSKLYGYGDAATVIALGGADIVLPEGTAVRIRAGATGIVA